MATITYNSQSLPIQVRKLSYTHTEKELTYSGVHAVTPSELKDLMAALRVDDATLVISGTGYSETFTLNAGNTPCTELRTIVEKVGEVSDGSGMVLVRFQVRAKFQSYRTNRFRTYSFNWVKNDQDIYVLTINGEVTAEDSSNTALEMFDAGIETIENVAKALLGDNADGNLNNTLFESPITNIQIDRNNGDLTFTRVFQQLPDPANIATLDIESRDATIVFPTWSVERIHTLRKGLNKEPLTMYSVRWTARLKKDKGQTAFISQYDSIIQALVIKRIKQIFSESDTLILEENRIDYGRSQQTAAGSWTVSSNGKFVSFSEILSSEITVADSDQVADGADFTEAPFSLGMRLDLTQTVRYVQRGTPPPAPPAPVIIFGGVALQTFLRKMTPEESNEIVGKAVGDVNNTTGEVVEHTLNWRAEYRAYVKPGDPDYKKTAAGGDFTNIQGKIIIP